MENAYDVNTITYEQFKDLIANGDDSHDNQIRVTKSGIVFLSEDTVGADQIEDIAFRFESFDAENDYIGKAASEDENHVSQMYNALKSNWDDNCPKTYIDDWRINPYKNYV